MPKPSNPAIIIGLGGTGQWALTYVKKNLLDTYGEVPPTVRLLSFDTTSEKTEVKVEKGEEHARVGNIQLEAGEFVYLGGNIRGICSEIKKEKRHNQISSWLQADYYLTSLDDDSFELSKGAGQRRPFGRMAVFYDLIQHPPQIIGKIEQTITDVMSKNERRQPIEIYIVCSLAGGTGSGMFIDIAHMTRKLAEKAQVPFAMRAFLVLQNAFQSVIDINLILANSFAAMREMDRFLLVFDREYPIYYAEDKAQREPLQVYRSIYNSKLFDNCYILDARRKNLPLDGTKPWLGMFPAVAECITALLDPETGDTFAQHYKNVNNRVAQNQVKLGKALYSSLGTYTYILPVEDMLETAAHRAALELLRDRLFKIVEDPRTGARRITIESQRELRDVPLEAMKVSFHSDKTPGGTPNILYFQQMMLTLEGGNLNDPQYIGDFARRGIELLSWLSPVEKDDAVNLISQSIQSIIDASLASEVVTSEIERDDTHSGADRILRDIKRFREKKLGYEDAGGRIPGELQKGIAEYALLNRRRFRRILSELMSIILNGENSDPVVAKSGKMPYVQEVLGWMIKSLDEFGGFLKRVWDYRAKSGEMSQARDDAIRTRQIMDETKDLTGFLDRLKKTATHAQEDYIAAEDYLFALEREDVLYRALVEYNDMFRDIVEDAKTQLDRWAHVLTLGGPVESKEKESGAYTLLLDRAAQIKRRRDEQQTIKVYQYLTDEEYETDLYKQMIDGKWGEVLKRFKWEIAFQHEDANIAAEMAEDGQVRYRYVWEKEHKPDFIVRCLYSDQLLYNLASYQTSASEANARFLVDKLRPYFADIRNETIADRFQKLRRAEGVAKEMLDNTGALVNFDPTKQNYLERHNFVCVNRGIQVDYFNDLGIGLKKEAPNDQDNQVIGLTNKHRCVVLSTLDLIVGQDIDPVMASRKAYLDYIGDHRLLHNFPAEVNASGFEDRITRPPISEARRLLTPSLVALLEDKDMARRYVLCRVFNMIREEVSQNDPNKTQWVLTLDRKGRRDLAYRVCLTPPSSDKPKELDAMTGFVFVKIDKDTGARYIQDVTAGVNFQVEPKSVDEAIELRQKAILNGREMVALEYNKLLEKNASLLNSSHADARAILVNGLRRFLLTDYDKYDRETRLDGLDRQKEVEGENEEEQSEDRGLKKYIEAFLDDNRDCLAVEPGNPDQEAALRNALTRLTVDLLKEKISKVKSASYSTLVRILEDYIGAKVLPMRSDPDQLTHDLGSIIHLILWDEIERLERMAAS